MSKTAQVVDGEASESDSDIEEGKSPDSTQCSKAFVISGEAPESDDESKIQSPSTDELDAPLHTSMFPSSPTKLMHNSLLHQKLWECNVSLRATIEGLVRHSTDICAEKLTTSDRILLSVQMLLPLLSILAMTLAHPQNLDPSMLIEVFGTPPTTARDSNLPPRLEDITVKPTVSGLIHKDSNGDDCQCVPYYLCNNELIAVDIDNPNITGYGKLDIRFGVNDCQESVERCCKSVKPHVEPEIPDKRAYRGCGFRNPRGVDFFITGGNGNEAQFGEFPWVVALLDARNGSYVGVGVLIHPQVVMTGAHVAFKYSPGGLIARAGEWDTQTSKERLKSQERLVSDMVLREDFKPKSLQNDMALLRLQQPVELADHINVICLPDQDEDFENSRQCVANGWGKDVFGASGRYAVILKRVEADMVPHDRCAAALKKTRLGTYFQLHESFVCAGGEEGRDTCQGDGGAPLACPIGNNRYKLAGLVAWGIGCGNKDLPAVYARVSMFRRWVDDSMLSWGLETDGYTVY